MNELEKIKISKFSLIDCKIISIKYLELLEEFGVVKNDNNVNNKRHYVVDDGNKFNYLKIDEDDFILKAGASPFGDFGKEYCTLEVNLRQSSSVEECNQQLIEIQKFLQDEYKILVDFSEAKLKEVEINRTFRLEDNFVGYYRPLNLIMTNLPSYLKNQMDYKKIVNGSSDYQTFYASSKTTNTSKRYLSFKIYNKTKQLEPIQKITEPYMRVEFRLVGAEKVKKALKTNKFSEITDELINNYFDEQIEKLIIKPFEKWQKDRDKYVVKLMKTQRQLNLYHWQSNVLRILVDEEIATKKPILLDVEELISLVNKLKLKSNRTCDIKANFRKQARKFEKSFCNNDHAKMTEIIDKLTAKDCM